MPDNRIVVRNVPDQRIPVKNDVPVYLNSTIVKKIITSNGTYRAAEEKANGFDPVVVNVPTYEAENAELTAQVTELTETVAEKTAKITQLESEVVESFDRGYNNGFSDGVNSVEPVYESASGVLYKKNTVINSEVALPLTSSVNGGYENAEYLETVYAPNANRWTNYYTFRGATNIKSVCLPKVATVASYLPFFGIDYSGDHLKTIQLGSIGYPVEKIQYSLGSTNNQPTTITIYVADDVTLPLSGAPWGFAGATIIYRSATTGEVITV